VVVNLLTFVVVFGVQQSGLGSDRLGRLLGFEALEQRLLARGIRGIA
jgi:hypothetical protein